MSDTTTKPMLTVREAAVELGLDPETVRSLCRRGRIPYVRYGTGRNSPIHLRRKDIDKFIETHTHTPRRTR